MIELLYLIAVFLTALGLGNFILTRSSFQFSDAVEETVFSSGIGFAVLGYLVFLLGMAHALYSIAFYILIFAGLLLTAKFWFGLLKRMKFSAQPDTKYGRFALALLLMFIGVILIITLIKSLAPPIGNDPLVYHLDLPKRFLKHHAILYFPYTANSTFPLFMEMFYTLGLALRSAELAQMIHWSFGVLAALAVFGLSRKWLRPEFALLSSAVFLLIPGIFHQMPTANNDIGVMLFFMLQAYAVWKWIESNQFRWLVLAGVFAGIGLSIKLIALLGIVATILVLVAFSNRNNIKRLLSVLVVFSAVCFVFSFIWYLRSYLLTGNPVFPFFPSFFGGGGHAYNLGKHGEGKTLMDLFLLPWKIIAFPDHFGGRGNQLGPLFIWTVPAFFIFYQLKQSKVFKFILIYIAAFTLFWFLGPQNLRFFFPVAGLLSIVLAGSFQWICSKTSKITCAVLFSFICLSFLFSAVIAVYYLRSDFKPSLGLINKSEYLSTAERSYDIAQYINQNLPQHAEILSEEIRSFYFTPDLSRYNYYAQRAGMKQNSSVEKFVESLKRNKIGYLLYVDINSGQKSDNPFERLGTYSPDHDKYLIKLKSIQYRSPDGKETAIYHLYKLK